MVIRIRTYWQGSMTDTYCRRVYPWQSLWWRMRRAKYGQVELTSIGPIVMTAREELWS